MAEHFPNSGLALGADLALPPSLLADLPGVTSAVVELVLAERQAGWTTTTACSAAT